MTRKASLSDHLTDAQRAAIRAPIESARTFPRHAFIDPEFFQLEIERAFAHTWVAVDFGTSIPEPGDIKPVTLLGRPLLLVRGGDGVARVFHNVCPFDGCEVAINSARGLDSIITPYHGWNYDLDGRLIAAGYWDGTPSGGEGPPAGQRDLATLPCHEWLQTLFVWFGGDPLPFETVHANMLSHLSDLDFERLRIGSTADHPAMVRQLTINANWKTVYENYSPNVYHESFVHEMYRKSPLSPRVKDGRKTYTEINYPCGFLGLCYDNSIGSSFYGESSLPAVRNRDGSANAINTIANCYPNWVITILGNAGRIAMFLPEGPESGTQQVATLFDRGAAADPELETERKKSERAGLTARIEDNRICESIQRARHSPAFESQYYAPFWDAMHYTLNNLILDRLEAGD